MSDKTPPPGEPTPTPDESSDGLHDGPQESTGADTTPTDTTPTDTTPTDATPTGAEGETATPPVEDATAADADAPPPPPAEGTFGGAYAPPPPAKKSRAPWVIAVAVVLVLALIGGAAALIVTLTGEKSHAIAIPATAGGMKRDTTKENELKTQLGQAEEQFKSQADDVTYVKSGVYNQDDESRGPEGALVFLGAKLSKEQSPTAFVDSFGKQAGANGLKISKLSVGEGGGQAVCASQPTGETFAICAWATKDSMGELIPTVPGWDAEKLGKVLLDLREDVETTE